MARNQGTVTYAQQLPNESVAMDPVAFDTLQATHGIQMQHWRAMKCPVGMKDPLDIRRSHPHHAHCSLGYIYRYVGIVTVVFTSNGSNAEEADAGLIDGSTCQVTLGRFYDDCPDKEVHVSYADRFYLQESRRTTEVPDWHTFASSGTGIDRLQYQARRVEHIIDSSGREYDPALYSIQDGSINWLTQDRPAANQVCTAWYTYQPHWYCSRIIHQVRVTQVMTTEGPEMVRMAYSAVLQRENVFRTETNDPDIDPTKRMQPPPEDGSFGG